MKKNICGVGPPQPFADVAIGTKSIKVVTNISIGDREFDNTSLNCTCSLKKKIWFCKQLVKDMLSTKEILLETKSDKCLRLEFSCVLCITRS